MATAKRFAASEPPNRTMAATGGVRAGHRARLAPRPNAGRHADHAGQRGHLAGVGAAQQAFGPVHGQSARLPPSLGVPDRRPAPHAIAPDTHNQRAMAELIQRQRARAAAFSRKQNQAPLGRRHNGARWQPPGPAPRARHRRTPCHRPARFSPITAQAPPSRSTVARGRCKASPPGSSDTRRFSRPPEDRSPPRPRHGPWPPPVPPGVDWRCQHRGRRLRARLMQQHAGIRLERLAQGNQRHVPSLGAGRRPRKTRQPNQDFASVRSTSEGSFPEHRSRCAAPHRRC